MIDGWMPSVGSSRRRKARPHDERACDGKLLLLAAGEIAAAPAKHVFQHRKQLEDVVGHRAVGALQWRIAGLQIFLHSEQSKDLAALRHESDARPGAIVRRAPVELIPLQEYRA